MPRTSTHGGGLHAAAAAWNSPNPALHLCIDKRFQVRADPLRASSPEVQPRRSSGPRAPARHVDRERP
jgi:hypothetical protein